METCSKPAMVKEFIEQRMKQLDQQYQQTENVMDKLRLATKKASFANVLSLYLGDESQMTASLTRQAYAYFDAQCYEEAILRARLARKSSQNNAPQKKQQIGLLIVNCMLKQKKYEDANDMLSGIEPKYKQIDYYKLKLQILQQIKSYDSVLQTLEKLEKLIDEQYSKSSVEYGFFLILRGQSFGKFGKYEQAISELNIGMDILIEKKCKQKKKIADIYSKLAFFYKKNNNSDRQYTSLICAHSMIRQVPNSEKETIEVIHLLVRNLMARQEYEKALNELNKVKSLEKQFYGQYSVNVGKTMRKMSEILQLLHRKGEAKKYEQESARILGTNAPSNNSKTVNKLRQLDLNTLK